MFPPLPPGADLREIQRQLDHLGDRTDPCQVFTFLSLRRDVMFLEFEAALRFNLRDTFLGMGNKEAYNVSELANGTSSDDYRNKCVHITKSGLAFTQILKKYKFAEGGGYLSIG